MWEYEYVFIFIIPNSLVGTIDGIRDTNSIQAGWMKLKSDLGIIYRGKVILMLGETLPTQL
jgi:hypothetical protein